MAQRRANAQVNTPITSLGFSVWLVKYTQTFRDIPISENSADMCAIRPHDASVHIVSRNAKHMGEHQFDPV